MSARIEALFLPSVSFLALAQVDELADAKASADARQGARADHGGPALGQVPLGQVGVVPVQGVSDGEPQDGVAQEFQPLVGGDAAVFVGVGAVGERKTKRPGVNR